MADTVPAKSYTRVRLYLEKSSVRSSLPRFVFLFFFFGDEENLWQQTQVNDDDVTCGRHKPLNFKVFIFFRVQFQRMASLFPQDKINENEKTLAFFYFTG